MGVLSVLLHVLIIFFPFGLLIRYEFLRSISVNALDVVLIYIFVAVLFVGKRRVILIAKEYKFLSIFIVIGFVSLLLNLFRLSVFEFFVSFLYLARFALLLGPLFAFSLVSGSFKKRFVPKVILSGFAFVLIGVVQFFLFPSLVEYRFLGWDDHLNRLFSTLFDPNYSGAIIVMVVLLMTSQYFSKEENGKIRYFYLVGSVISLAALFLTYSRSSFLMMGISFIVYMILIKRFMVLFGMLAVAAGVFFLLPRDLSGEGTKLLRTASIEGRVDSYSEALSVVEVSPLWGVGFNSYRYALREVGGLDSIEWETTNAGSAPSNSFLFILATTGIIGFFVFALFYTRLIIKVKKSMKKKVAGNDFLKAALISIIIGIAVHSLFQNSFFFPHVLVYMFLILGVAASRDFIHENT